MTDKLRKRSILTLTDMELWRLAHDSWRDDGEDTIKIEVNPSVALLMSNDEIKAALNSESPVRRDENVLFCQNVERLRKELGWSRERLGNEAGFDRSTVHRHMTGKLAALVRTRKVYADALSRGLKRTVTVEELESHHATR